MTGRCRILVNAVVRASEPLPVSCWGAGRHPKGRNVVEQPRTARLDAAVGGAAPHGDVIHHVPALTFHSRSSRPHPPLDGASPALYIPGSEAIGLKGVPTAESASRGVAAGRPAMECQGRDVVNNVTMG